jgi:hypothetical protein
VIRKRLVPVRLALAGCSGQGGEEAGLAPQTTEEATTTTAAAEALTAKASRQAQAGWAACRQGVHPADAGPRSGLGEFEYERVQASG